MNRKKQNGFTIIELAIATLIFSVLLAICMAAFLNVGRLFIKGVNLSLTQEDSRTITDSISNDIRFSQATPDLSHINDAAHPYFCVGLHRYKFMLYNHVDSSSWDLNNNYGLVRQNTSVGCPAPAANDGTTSPVEMLSNNMQLNLLKFGPAAGNTCDNKLCTVTINLLFYGADNGVFVSSEHPNNPQAALRDADARCEGALQGSQFCATTSYSVSVLQSFQ